MFVFLQSWRATLIPVIAVPVVLLGTFAMLYILGFSINTLTLFGLVLAVGLLVDDAIVVVENVERMIHEKPEMTAKRSDGHLDAADPDGARRHRARAFRRVPADGVLRRLDRRHLPAVLGDDRLGDVPVGGHCADASARRSPPTSSSVSMRAVEETWIGRRAPRVAQRIERGRVGFNTGFERAASTGMSARVSRVVDRKWLFLAIYVGVCAAAGRAVLAPADRLPSRPRTRARRWSSSACPPARPWPARSEVQRAVEDYFLHGPEKKNIKTLFVVAGGGGGGAAGQNTGQAYPQPRRLRRAQGQARTPPKRSSQRASAAFRGLRDAQVFALVPGAIRGLGQSTGFTMELHNSSGMSRRAVRRRRATACSPRPTPIRSSTSVRLSELPDVASLKINIDQQRIASLGLTRPT